MLFRSNLVEMAPDGIITIDMKGSITSCNPVALALSGRPEDEIIGKHFTKTGSIQIEDIPKYLKMFSAVLEGKAPAPVEYLFIRADGTTAWAEAHYALVEDDGKAAGVQVILRDITERKRTEELARIQRDLLQESERKYRLLIETADAAISVISGDGDFLLLNNQAAAQMDGKPDDFMGKNLSDVVQEETLREFMAEIREIINSGQGHTREASVKLSIGEKWLSINIQPIVEQDGSISSIQIISQDITKYKKQEEALLRNLEREDKAFQHGRLEIVDTILHNIGNAMNSVTTGAGTAQKKVSRLTRYLCSLADAIKKNQDNFSHYVEKDPQGQKVAPLIIALADEFGGNDGNLMETVDRVADRAEHVAEIIRTVESVTGKMYRKDIDLRKAVEDAITVLKYSIEKRHIEVDYDCDRAPAEISIHESQFHQMLVNLIKNSMEAIDELEEKGGTNETHSIEIICSTESDSLVLEVTDDGIGRSEERRVGKECRARW